MRIVEPKVYLIAETKVLHENLVEMLREVGGDTGESWYKRTSPASASEGEYLIEVAGRICYKSFGVGLNPNVSKIREDSRDYVQNILAKGDGSVLEHSSCTFAFIDVSRVFTHELVRHRAGTAMSQESLRYVRTRDVGMWLPPDLKDVEEVRRIVESIEEDFKRLEGKFNWDTMSFDAKKRLTSALRRILPQGMATNIIWSANHRTIRHVITMRTHEAAEVEIRKVFDKVAQIVKERYPLLYHDFEREELGDGTGSWKPKYVKV